MSESLSAELELPLPDVVLAGAGGGRAASVADMVVELQRILEAAAAPSGVGRR